MVGLYIRLSRLDDDLDEYKQVRNSVENQRKLLTEYLDEMPDLRTEETEEFVDDGWSGANFQGKHAVIVDTHTDRPHIHNHIIFNSTTLDGGRKFKNFYLSYLDIQKISDRLCVQHGMVTAYCMAVLSIWEMVYAQMHSFMMWWQWLTAILLIVVSFLSGVAWMLRQIDLKPGELIKRVRGFMATGAPE